MLIRQDEAEPHERTGYGDATYDEQDHASSLRRAPYDRNNGVNLIGPEATRVTSAETVHIGGRRWPICFRLSSGEEARIFLNCFLEGDPYVW